MFRFPPPCRYENKIFANTRSSWILKLRTSQTQHVFADRNQIYRSYALNRAKVLNGRNIYRWQVLQLQKVAEMNLAQGNLAENHRPQSDHLTI